MKKEVTSISIFMTMLCNGSFIVVCSTVELNAKHKIKRKTLNEKELNGKYKLKRKTLNEPLNPKPQLTRADL